jgi:AcrR family transcriptional regulator
MVTRTDSARGRLIESAIGLIHAGSYGAVSVNDLCAAAEVKKGSFYHFFPTKRDLALAAIDAYWERHRISLFQEAFSEAGDIGEVDVHVVAGRLLAYLEGLYLLAKVENDPQVFARFGGITNELITADGAR